MMDMATTPLPALSSSPRPALRDRAATAARDAGYLIAGLPAGVITFSVLVCGLSLAGGLAITLLGIPVLLGTLYAARGMGDAERLRAATVGARIERTERPWRGGIVARAKAAATDAGAWRDTAWGLLLMPIGIAGFTVAVTAWSVALGLLTSLLWYWALPDNEDQPNATLELLNAHTVVADLARVALGALLVPVAYAMCRATAEATVRAARALLGH